MKKLRLDVESLRVDSFETDAARSARQGTVRAHAGNDPLWDHDHAGLWTFGADCRLNVTVITGDHCMYSDICSLGCAETSDCPQTP